MPTPHNSRVVFAAGALFALSLSGCDNIKIRREPIPNAQDGTQPDPSNAQDPNTDPPQPLKPSAQVRTQSLCEKSCEREGLRACEGIRFVQPEDNCVEHCVPSLGDTFQDIQDETCVDALLSLFECSTDQECVEASKLLSALDKRNKFSFTDLGACTMELAIAMQSCHSQAPDQDQEPGKDKEPPQPQPEPDPDPDPEPAVAQFFDQRWTQMHALAVPAGHNDVRLLLSEEPIEDCLTAEWAREAYIYLEVEARRGIVEDTLVSFLANGEVVEALGTLNIEKTRYNEIVFSLDAGIPGIVHVKDKLSARRCR